MSEKQINQPKLKIKPRILIWLSFIVIALVISGCKKDPDVVFIEGTWYYKNAHLANIPGESAQETTWDFNNYYFSTYSCCFVKASYEGYYSITDKKEHELTLELYDMRGRIADMVLSKDDSMVIIIKIDPEAGTIMVNRDGPYARVSP